tara:strand:+ start:118 stop:498 length:381 start_codon:yes stop_codon:yes gene_type:complete
MSFNRVKQMTDVQNEALELFKKKNADYGDSFATYGPIGVIVRMQDKINRLVSVSKRNVSFVRDESLRDTLIDLHNYSAMAIMLMDEKNESNFIPIKEEVTNEIGQPKKTPQQDCIDAIEENGYFGC